MVKIRRATEADIAAASRLITNVVTEVYGHLIEDIASTAASNEHLIDSLLATANGKVVGVGLSVDEVVDDLWLLPEARGEGIGSTLLRMMEIEIAKRDYTEGKLRVFTENILARRFYESHGWKENRRYPHERLGHGMIDFVKNVRATR